MFNNSFSRFVTVNPLALFNFLSVSFLHTAKEKRRRVRGTGEEGGGKKKVMKTQLDHFG